ncbi:MAG TPA: ATP-binding protein [Humisphaera sp.]|jgi:two-component system sensor kinase FixL|nr:ATP-binding protein [Humisphaera sp.]
MNLTSTMDAAGILDDAELRLRETANAVPAMIWMSGPGTPVTFFYNKGWLDFAGGEPSHGADDHWEAVHPDDRERCTQIFAKAFAAIGKFSMECRRRAADGEYRWLLDSGVPRFAPGGAFLGYIGCAADISGQRRADERFRQVMEAAPSAMLLVNSQDRITQVNAQTQGVFGYAPEELIGKTVQTVIPGWAALAGSQGVRGGASTARPPSKGIEAELYGKRKDGSQAPIEIGLNHLAAKDETLTLASVINLTERRNMEREQSRQRNELAHLARVAVLGELTGALAHELNQPLTAILSNAQAAQGFLADGRSGIDEMRAILEDIVSEDRRAGEVIRRLRTLFRKGEVQCEAISLNEMAADALKLMNNELVNHHIKVRTEFTATLPPVDGDRVQIQQVLINLILNAADAMADKPIDKRILSVSSQVSSDGDVEVCVSDTGCGIPTDQLERLFEPFFTTKSQGMGLGLTVCRTIITAHSGKLSASNNPVGGACFHVTIPPRRTGAGV